MRRITCAQRGRIVVCSVVGIRFERSAYILIPVGISRAVKDDIFEGIRIGFPVTVSHVMVRAAACFACQVVIQIIGRPGSGLLQSVPGLSAVVVDFSQVVQRFGRVADSQLALDIGHLVIALQFFSARRDNIVAQFFTGFTAHLVLDQLFRIFAILQLADGRRQFGILFTESVRPGHIVCRYGNGCPCNDEGVGVKYNLIVTLRFFPVRCNGIFADIFAFCATQRVTDDVLPVAVRQSCHGRGQFIVGLAVFLALVVVGLHGRRCRGNFHLARHIGHRVVLQFFFARNVNRILADILTVFTVQAQPQRFADFVFAVVVHQSRNARGQYRIIAAVDLSVHTQLAVRGNGQRGLGDCLGVRDGLDKVVLRILGRGGNHAHAGLLVLFAEFAVVVGIRRLAIRRKAGCNLAVSVQRVWDYILFVAVLQALYDCLQFRIRRAIHLGGGLHDNSGCRLGDFHRAGLVDHVIVALHFGAVRRNRVLVHILALGAINCVADNVFFVAVLQAGNFCRQGRIRFAVDLCLVFCAHGRRRSADGQYAGLVFHVVVSLYRFTTRSDRIGANVFAFRARRRPGNHSLGVSPLQSGHINRQFGIRVAVGLVLVNRGHRRRHAVDGQFSLCEHYMIVILFCVTLRGNCVTASILSGLAAHLILDETLALAFDQATNGRCQLRIVVAVVLALRFRGYGCRRLADGQLTGPGVHLELGGHIVAVFIQHLRRTGYVHRILACVRRARLGRQARHRVGIAVNFECIVRQTLDVLWCSVVCSRISACAVHGNFILGISVRHGQRAVFRFDAVVGCLCAFLQCVAEGIVIAADDGLTPGHVVFRAFAFSESIARHGDDIVGQRLTVVFLGIRCGGQHHVPCRDRQNVVHVDHVIVALFGTACGNNRVAADIFAFFTAQFIADDALPVAVLQAGNFRRQFGILIAVSLALDARGHGCRRLAHGQCARHIGHVIVALLGTACGSDRVAADILSIFAAQLIADDVLSVAVLQAGNFRRQFGILIAIGLVLVNRSHGCCCLAYCQRTRYIGHVIVALLGAACGSNRVTADILAFIPAQSISDDALGLAVLQAFHGCRQFRICVAVSLALVDRSHCYRCPGDGLYTRCEGHIVVALLLLALRRDGVGPGTFTFVPLNLITD